MFHYHIEQHVLSYTIGEYSKATICVLGRKVSSVASTWCNHDVETLVTLLYIYEGNPAFKTPFAKWRLFCSGCNVLNLQLFYDAVHDHEELIPTLIARFIGPTWTPPGGLSSTDGPHVGPMNLAIWGPKAISIMAWARTTPRIMIHRYILHSLIWLFVIHGNDFGCMNSCLYRLVSIKAGKLGYFHTNHSFEEEGIHTPR